MTTNEAKGIPLEYILSDLGAVLAKRTADQAFYFARANDKKSPSFKVDIKKNLWYDHGAGIGGTTIDAVKFLKNMDFADAMRYLNKLYGNMNLRDFPIPIIKPQKWIKENKEHNYEILQIRKIFSYSLKSYLDERGIDIDIANKFMKEIVYKFKNSEKKFYALGFKNDSDGWEVRNPFDKRNLFKKDITTIKNGSNTIKIFEGMFDFLTYVTMNEDKVNNLDFLILNSTALINKLQDFDMNRYINIDCYFDNDDTGKKTFSKVKELLKEKEFNIRDLSFLYKGFNDFNEYHQQEIKSNKSFKNFSKTKR